MRDVYSYYVIYCDEDEKMCVSPHHSYSEAVKELIFIKDWRQLPARVVKVVC